MKKLVLFSIAAVVGTSACGKKDSKNPTTTDSGGIPATFASTVTEANLPAALASFKGDLEAFDFLNGVSSSFASTPTSCQSAVAKYDLYTAAYLPSFFSAAGELLPAYKKSSPTNSKMTAKYSFATKLDEAVDCTTTYSYEIGATADALAFTTSRSQSGAGCNTTETFTLTTEDYFSKSSGKLLSKMTITGTKNGPDADLGVNINAKVNSVRLETITSSAATFSETTIMTGTAGTNPLNINQTSTATLTKSGSVLTAAGNYFDEDTWNPTQKAAPTKRNFNFTMTLGAASNGVVPCTLGTITDL